MTNISRFTLNNAQQPEECEGDEIEENNLKQRQIERKKYRDKREDKKCFVMNSGQQPFGEQHENNKH